MASTSPFSSVPYLAAASPAHSSSSRAGRAGARRATMKKKKAQIGSGVSKFFRCFGSRPACAAPAGEGAHTRGGHARRACQGRRGVRELCRRAREKNGRSCVFSVFLDARLVPPLSLTPSTGEREAGRSPATLRALAHTPPSPHTPRTHTHTAYHVFRIRVARKVERGPARRGGRAHEQDVRRGGGADGGRGRGEKTKSACARAGEGTADEPSRPNSAPGRRPRPPSHPSAGPDAWARAPMRPCWRARAHHNRRVFFFRRAAGVRSSLSRPPSLAISPFLAANSRSGSRWRRPPSARPRKR